MMSLCCLVWLNALQTSQFLRKLFIMTTILPMISLKKVLRTKLTILPMYQICLPNVNTIHDLRLTSLYLQSSEDCHFGVENISLVRMLNNPQYLYNVLLESRFNCLPNIFICEYLSMHMPLLYFLFNLRKDINFPQFTNDFIIF